MSKSIPTRIDITERAALAMDRLSDFTHADVRDVIRYLRDTALVLKDELEVEELKEDISLIHYARALENALQEWLADADDILGVNGEGCRSCGTINEHAATCRVTRHTAILTERDSPKIEAIATHVDNLEKGGRTERDDLGKGGAPE